jgi:hypothetical protein
MKQLLLTFLAILSAISVAMAQHGHEGMSADKPSTHGMLIFGKEKIYASHLPLFQAPHNYQIILELELSTSDKKKLVSDQQAHPEFTTYTIEPEKFILPEMVKNPRPFTVNLYRGHFERGGTKLLTNIRVTISKIVFFKKLKADEAKAITTDYILFGNTKEQFIAHHITNKPDFEQIIQVKAKPAAMEQDTLYTIVRLNTTLNHPVGVSGNTVEAQGKDKKQALVLLRQLYLEFDDLQ